MKKEPVYQPRGTRDGTAGLKGKTVWALLIIDYGGSNVQIFTTKRKAEYHVKRHYVRAGTRLFECKLR